MSETVNSTAVRDENLSVVITAQGIKVQYNVQYNGPPLSIIKSILAFFAKQYPEVDLAKKISLNYNTGYLTQKYSRFIKIDSGKVEVTVQPEVASAHLTESPLSLSDELHVEDYIAMEADLEPKSQYQTKHQTKWSTKEFIALHLVASRIAHGLGITQNEGMKISDLESATRSNPKSIVPRLSEMLKSGYITKDVRFDSESLSEGKQNEPTLIYRITTLGTHWLNNIDKKQQ